MSADAFTVQEWVDHWVDRWRRGPKPASAASAPIPPTLEVGALGTPIPARRRRARSHAADWDGVTTSYSCAKGPHPCVLLVPCEVCKAPAGKLCRGPRGVRYATHYKRRDAWRAMKKA